MKIGIEILELSKQLGNSIAGNLGGKVLHEIELSYVSGLFPRFGDNPLMRIRQNILLYWQYGYYKSTLLRIFAQAVPNTIKTIDISSMSLEKIFGSIDEKKKYIIEPAFTNNVRFVFISELASVLGRRDYKQFADTMNLVLEGERVTRQTLKLGHGQIDEPQLAELRSRGVEYNSQVGELSYTPNACVLAATRPLDYQTFTYLNKSGHFSRYHVIQHNISDKEASEYLRQDFKIDQNALASLKQVNELLSKIQVKEMKQPQETLLSTIYDAVEGLVKDEISNGPKRRLSEVINPRLKGDIIREFAAHAFLRTAFQNGYNNIDILEYTEDDVNFVLERAYHFIEFALNPLIADDVTIRMKEKTKRERTKETIIELLSDKIEHGREDIVNYVHGAIDVSTPMIDLVLKELLDEGKTTHSQFGFYKIR